ncbi:S-layer homology domain-containing protein [Paenibacillus sp. WQ 127069]|uniref:S-layer homology domain-containing protein n=1 Tax=Paenibacillus baimaensis TaxID=2982185 RepID=A0ABT2ULE4_9BACL|nr:S-layer homology domain-containing protein [Paenibacillus sp. WQ 127069]MCU6795443.1 S-layer homology domain-containing protein [Paenibacillus sp. WQ 127069]
MSHSIKKVMCGMCLASLLAMALPVAGLPDSISYDKAFAAEVGTGVGTGAIKDGSYKISYMIKKFGTEQASVMQDYVITPGTLTVAGGKYYMTVTLKQGKQITAFKVEHNGTLKDAEIVGTNEAKNTRDVRFEVTDLSKKLKAWVKIDWAEVNYFHEYDIEISIDKDSAKLIEGSSGPSSKADTPAGSAPIEQKPVVDNNVKAKDSEQAVTKPALSDINGHWAQTAIEQAVAQGIVSGYEDGSFHPDGEISRSEFAVLLGRALKLEGKKAELAFSDRTQIPEWSRSYLEQAVGAGIIGSYEDNTFRPNRNIVRSEIAVMIVRALGLQRDTSQKLSFADEGDIPQWAYAEVAAASSKGIISGRGNNLYAPNAGATRAEAVTLLLALSKLK